MSEVNWVAIAASLLGGGAVGAVITGAISALRNRRQPIGHRVSILPIFQGTLTDSTLPARLTITDPAGRVELDNLFVVEVQLANRGNRDWSNIAIGLTLPGGQTAIHVSAETQDRHHVCSFPSAPRPNSPLPIIDFILQPFNRGDSYVIRAYTVTPTGCGAPEHPQISSPEPVNFRSMPTLTELAAEAARTVSVNLGPVRLSLRK
jgi:hypothetical protein